ncbi:MAG: hypothetical protein IT572_04710 [Deltaproteobacteria bacterium]|nr:hypothetical protein [Deltaproteobacteria bacterium]
MPAKFRIALLAGLFCLFFAASLRANDVSVEEADAEIVITMRAELCPDPKDNPDTEAAEGPTVEQVQQFLEAHLENIRRIWNACTRTFRMGKGRPAKPVRFVFDITVIEDCDQERDPDRKRIKVHLGKPPPESRKKADTENLWIEETTSKNFAHELGHSMGLGEEYKYNGGPTRQNLMGRGENETVLAYHITTIIFTNAGNPDRAESQRRATMKTCLRMKDQKLARQIAAQNGINDAQYDAYKEIFTANNSEIQPEAPQ